MSSIAASPKLHLRTRVPDAAVRARLPGQVEEAEFPVVVRGECVVYRPDGEPLCILIKEAYPEEIVEAAWPALHALRKYTTDNRASYTGSNTTKGLSAGGNSTRALGPDGKPNAVQSAVVGYFDRQGGRHPYCRTTAFVANEVEKWRTILPIVARSGELFSQRLPSQFAAQAAAAAECDPHWIIEGTPFSTLTVNNNTRAGIHKDAGDYKLGFGLMAVFRRGAYDGCWLGFPQYGVAVDCGHRDLLLFNPHEYHANTPYRNQSEGAERISVVLYLREKMKQCGTPEQEVQRARHTRGRIE